MTQKPKLHLLTLPPEVRESIYKLLLNPSANRLWEPDEYSDYNYSVALVLFKLNKQIHTEALKIFRDLNTFIRIETPWPEAREHVYKEGHTPILIRDEAAKRFSEHSMGVVIDAPDSPMADAKKEVFVVHLEDLEKFTKTWFYADLSHPGLNRWLRLSLELRDPYTPAWDDAKRMPKWLQRRLLLPFGVVKGLKELVVWGDPKPFDSVEEELRREQEVPYQSAEHCLREATRLKLLGNECLKNGDYAAALKHYTEAWEAIHVVVKGRKRHIHADTYFGRELREPPFEGKNGQSERLILRVHLVANTILVYLKMEDWEEAAFWGMRSIKMLREAMGADEHSDMPPEDEAVLGFPAADQMGKIYYRTAVAYRAMGEGRLAGKLLRVSAIYLPNDLVVQRELGEVSSKLG